MEFPELGKNCSKVECKQLDFLPMKCDACSKIFCKDHILYDEHNCGEAYRKNNQVPVCPLCDKPVPVKKGESPDRVVGAHIDSDCQSDPAKEKRKVYTNKCSAKGCKQKELIPFKCEKCHKNYCIRHRLETDHNCEGFQGSGQGVSRAGAAAMSRLSGGSSTAPPKSKKAPQQTTLSGFGKDLDRERRERTQQRQAQRPTASAVHSLQGTVSEDEALAQAMAMSLAQSQAPAQSQTTQRSNSKRQQEEEDAALARALAESEREARRRQRQPAQRERSCVMS